jgi:putative transposase
LNYAVTSNHIHLLVKDGQRWEVIPKTIQLIAGRTGQEKKWRRWFKSDFLLEIKGDGPFFGHCEEVTL